LTHTEILLLSFEGAMSGIEQISSLAGSVTGANPLATGAAGISGAGGGSYATALPDLPTIGTPDAEMTKSISNDFSKVLETYRVKSERVDNAVSQARSGEPSGPPNQRDMIKQLGDLYTYAVDTQLLVRTAGQLTTGVRQLVTGQ
jgi:hypothetical protein